MNRCSDFKPSCSIYWRKFYKLADRMDMCYRQCESCKNKHAVVLRGPRTMYYFEHEYDPNEPIFLCDPCNKDYQEYWNEMFEQARSGLL